MTLGTDSALTGWIAEDTYRYLRILITASALALCSIVLVVGVSRGSIYPSLSAHYHYDTLGAVFTGFLVAAGVGLIAYKSLVTFEDWALNIAGLAAIGVALFPTGCPDDLSTCTYPDRTDLWVTLIGLLAVVAVTAFVDLKFVSRPGTPSR